MKRNTKTTGSIRKHSPQELIELRDKAKRMYLIDGMSLRRIASYLGVSPVTPQAWKRKFGWDDLAVKAQDAKDKILLQELAGQVKKSDVVDEKYVLVRLKELSENARAESVQLGAVKALGEHLGMFDEDEGDLDNQTEIVVTAFDGEEEKTGEPKTKPTDEATTVHLDDVEVVANDIAKDKISTTPVSKTSPSQ